MRLFDIIKTAQQTSGTNIITLIKDVLSKTDQELLSLGLRQDILDKLKAISTKTSMSDITIKDLSPLLDIPSVLRPTNFDVVVKHAQAFIKGKISDEFVQSGQPALQGGISPVDPTPSIGVKSPLGITNKNKRKRTILPTTTSEPNKNTDNATKEFKIFEFMDKSEDKNWKQLVISPKAGALNYELVLMLSRLKIISDVTGGNQPSNNISSITKDKYVSLISSLKKNNWSTDLADINAESHLLNLDEQQELSNYAEVKAMSILDEYNNQWMYLISIPNMFKLTEDRQRDVVDCFTYAFVGETTNVNYSRELTDVSGKSIPRVRRCRPNSLNDIGTTQDGWLVRGDPSDFQRFLDICATRKVEAEEFAEMFVDDFNNRKFYSPSKKVNIGPHNSRLEGATSHDGYKNDEELIAEIQSVGNAGFKKKILSKDPNADVSRTQMYPMQVEGVKFLYSRTQAILADDTGVGKTAQAVTAAHLRLKTDTKKMDKDMKAIVLTKSTVVTQYKRDISYFTGIDIKDICTGDELFEDLKAKGYENPYNIIDANGKILIDIPKWKWCILNYEKFAIPPRPEIVRNMIDKKEEILMHYNIIMDKAKFYLGTILNDLFGVITIALNKSKELNETKAMGPQDKKEHKKNISFSAVQKYVDDNKLETKASIYREISNSSWYDAKRIDGDSDEIAKATAIDLFKVAFISSGGDIGLDQLRAKVVGLISSAKKEKETQVRAYVNTQNKRLTKTERLEEIIKLLQGTLSSEDREKLKQEGILLEKSKGEKDGAFSFGEEGKRNILTAYFSALSKLGVLDVVILDEVHTVKNGKPDDRADDPDDDHDANFTTFNIQAVTSGATNVWGASATVVANKPQDLYNQLKAINSPLGDLDYPNFVSQMSKALGKFSSDSVGTAIRDTLIQSKVFLNRSIYDMITDMQKIDPDLVFQKQSIYDKDIVDQEINNIFQTKQNELLREAAERGTLNNLNIYNIMRQSLAIAKAKSTIDFAIENLEKGERVGIFTDFVSSGEMIEKGIQSRLDQFPVNHKFFGKKVYLFNGKKDPNDRTNQVDEFMKNESASKYAAMVLTFGAGGVGLSIGNTANVVIFNDIPQTPVVDTQAKGRFHRMDSRAPTSVHYMILNQTGDEKLYSTLEEKLRIAAQISKLEQKDQKLVTQGFSMDSVERANIRKQLLRLATEEKVIEQDETAKLAVEGDRMRKSLANLIGMHPSQSNRVKAYANCWYKKASNIEIWY